VIDRTLLKIKVDAQSLGGEPCLIQIAIIDIDSQHPAGAAFLHLNRIEAAVAAYVENRGPPQIRRYGIQSLPPFDTGKIAQKMMGRGGTPCRLRLWNHSPSSEIRRVRCALAFSLSPSVAEDKG